MRRFKLILFPAFLVWFLLLLTGCKKNLITSTLSAGLETIMVVCSPASAGPGATITVAVLIAGNKEQIRVFGLDVEYDGQMFEFESAGNGDLNSSWATVDGNEITPGSVRVGGYVGGGNPIAVNSSGALGLIKLKVTGAPYGNGQKSPVWIRQYTDDIAGFTPQPAYAVFTLSR